jgi:hypothetical protein
MTRFWFTHCRGDEIRRTGALEAPTLPDALRVVSRRALPVAGDRLEIGAVGFPPARYECVFMGFDSPLMWRLANDRAA